MKKLLLATAISAFVFTGNASAVPVPTIGAVGAKSVDFSTTTGISKLGVVAATAYLDGSSAANPFVESAIILAAAPNTVIYKYYDSKKAAFTYIFETAATGFPVGLAASKTYVVHKRDKGGSVTAVLQASPLLANKNQVTFNTTLPAVVGSFGQVLSSVYPCTQPAKDPLVAVIANCTGTTPVTLAVKPTAAQAVNLSDVDAIQFASPLNGATTANSLATLAKTIPSNSIATQVFGAVVNLKLRNAMQKAMIASGALPGTCTVGDETEACMANFTTADMAALFGQGRLPSWKNFRFGGAAGQNLVEAQAPADQPGNSDVHMCSRTAGSGTLATAQVVFENAPCSINDAIQSPAALTIVNETGLAGSMKAYHATTGAGELENCLETMDGYNVANSTSGATMVANGTFTPLPTFVGTANFRWAVGILNTDRNKNNALPYRFTKIDGFSPSNKNVAEGKYNFWSELSLVGTPVPTAANNPLGAVLVALMSDPTTIAKSNVEQTNFATTGYLATAGKATFDTVIAPGTLISAAYDKSRPVNPFTHADNLNTAGSVNHCRVANVLGGKVVALPGLN